MTKKKLEKYRPLPRRTILMIGEITSEMVASVMNGVAALDQKKHRDGIRIRLFSHGGSGYAMLALYDALKHCQNEVTIEAFGECSSAAAILLQAASPGKRWLSPHCRMLLHNGLVDGELCHESGKNVQKLAGEVMAMDRVLRSILSERSGQSPGTVADWCREDTILSASEAIQMGVADRVIE